MTVIAITGAGGMIGRHLVEALTPGDATIRSLLLPGEASAPLLERTEIHRGDIRNAADIARLLDGADVVFHLASLVGRDANGVPLDKVRAVNVEGTRNVIAAAEARNIRRLVLLSTCSVYGLHGHADEVIDETAPRTPDNRPYDISKTEAEGLVMGHDPARLPWSVLQIPVALGGEHTLDKPTILAMSNILKFGVIPHPFPGTSWANYVFGRDVADALVLLASHPAAVGEAFIYSESAPLPRFLSWISRETGRRAVPLPVPRIILDLAARRLAAAQLLGNRRRFSAGKIETRLGFRPKIGLESGLQRTIRHYRKIGLIEAPEAA